MSPSLCHTTSLRTFQYTSTSLSQRSQQAAKNRLMAGEINLGAISGGCDAAWMSKMSFLSADAKVMNLKRLLNVDNEPGESSDCSVCSIASTGWVVAAMVMYRYTPCAQPFGGSHGMLFALCKQVVRCLGCLGCFGCPRNSGIEMSSTIEYRS
jgi:hypothetical protein